MTRPTCQGCGATLRARQWLCQRCIAAAEQAFTAAHPYADPNSHIRNRNAFWGDRAVLLAAIRSEQTAGVSA